MTRPRWTPHHASMMRAVKQIVSAGEIPPGDGDRPARGAERVRLRRLLKDALGRRPAAAACRLHWFDLKRAHAQPYPSYANPSSGIYERPRGEVTAVGLYGSPGAACSDWAQE